MAVSQRRPLSLGEREQIAVGLAAGMSNKEIANRIGRDPSVVCREVQRHGGREGYQANAADRAAAQSRRRPKPRKLDRDRLLQKLVAIEILAGNSPAQIARQLRRHTTLARSLHGRTVSREAIYRWIAGD